MRLASSALPRPWVDRLRVEVRAWRRRRNALRLEQRKAQWAARVGSTGFVDVRIQHATRLRLHYDSELCRLIYLGGYELAERHFLACFLRRGDVFVDVGANIGLYAVSAAALVGKQGAVYAFEPCSRSYRRLLDNVRLNKHRHVRCFQMALTDKETTELLKVPTQGHDAWSSLASPDCDGPLGAELVTTIAWDSFADRHPLPGSVSLMKIDIEGSEKRFLAGARKFLGAAAAPPLLIEFNDRALRNAGSSAMDLASALETLGFRIFRYDPAGRRLRCEPPESWPASWNAIACKDPVYVEERLRQAPEPDGLR